MRTFIRLVPITGLAALLLAGCAYRDHDRMGASVGRGGYYDGYYDGSYGAFNDGYWGKDGAFYYADGQRTWQVFHSHRSGNGPVRRALISI